MLSSSLARCTQKRLFLQSCRYYSSTFIGSPPQHAIYISTSTDPYFNLTFEDWLFRHKDPEKPLLLLYRDDPCVVIGRHQNPWKEVNLAALRERPGVPLIRRRSGGGTVYHDLGNTNFSIHLPRSSFDRHVTAQMILRAVRSLGINARVNERNDVCVDKDKMRSAYKMISRRAYHHGTMLISTQLETLGDLLRIDKENMISKGVASVRSPVCNLQQHSRNIAHDDFTSAVVSEFRKEYGIDEEVCTVDNRENLNQLDYIRQGLIELRTWEWTYGQTPEFTYSINRSFPWGDVIAQIRSKHGIILECAIQLVNSRGGGISADILTIFGKSLEGRRYGQVDIGDVGGPQMDLKLWLGDVMS